MNRFEVFDQFSNPKETLVGDFISVCIEEPMLEVFIRYDQLLNKLITTIHHNGEVLKEESIHFKIPVG